MTVVLPLLTLCTATVIQLTSSQSTHDVIQHGDYVTSCEQSEQVLVRVDARLNQLMTAVSQLQKANAQLMRAVGQLKTVKPHKNVTGLVLCNCV